MIGVILDDFPSIPKGDCAWITLGCITDLTATVIVIDYQGSTASQNSLCFIDDIAQIFRVMANNN